MPQHVTDSVPRATVPRRGFTLVELLVTLAILGIIAGSVLSVLTNQQRFYRDTNERIGLHRELRGSSAMLPMEMRAIASGLNDIHQMLDSAFYFNANYGSAIICEIGSDYIEIPPRTLSKKLAGWYSEPAAGDTIAIFDENTKSGAEDDRWLLYHVTDVESSGEVCAAPLFLEPTGETTEHGLRLTLVRTPTTDPATNPSPTLDPIPTTVGVGAVVRLLRPVRYSIFQPTKEPGKPWYLGYAEFRADLGDFSETAVVGGPFRPFDGSELDSAGVRFRYYDEAGLALTSLAQKNSVARVDVVLRGEATATSALSRGVMRDSVLFRVALRNRQ